MRQRSTKENLISYNFLGIVQKEVDMVKNTKNAIGAWAFLGGVVLAVILGILGAMTAKWVVILVVIGLIIGLLNIAEKEVQPFLMSGVILIIASALGQGVMLLVPVLDNVLRALLSVFVPALIIVAIKHVFSLARN